MSIRNTVLITAVGLTLTSLARAQASADKPLEEVVVTATRTAQSADNILASVTVITRDDLARSLSPDVVDLLRMQAGVELSRPGGVGQQTSIFIRGANSAHTLVLLDGVRINPGTLGNASLQNIPPETIERIEIVKGPRSTLYGSDAIGGVINIITRKRAEQGVSAEAQAGYGSYNTQRASGLLDVNGAAFNAGANVSYLKSDGFPTRANSAIDSGFDNITLGGHASANMGPVELNARVYQTSGKAAYLDFFGGPLDQDYVDRVTRLDAASQVNQLWRTQLVVSRMDNSIEQNQPVSFIPGEYDYVKTHRNAVDWQNDLALEEKHRLTAGAMYSDETADALSYGSRFDRKTYFANAYIQHQYAEEAHSLLLAVGGSHYSTFGDHVTWNAEYGYAFPSDTRLALSAGRAFRAPNATDLYGFGGNPALDPEQSRTYELSLRQRIGEHQSASLTAFANDIEDLINFDFNTFTMQNIARARIRGAEVRYELRGEEWRLHVDATYQDPRDRDTDQLLLRRAQKSASAGYAQKFGMLEIGANALYSGSRKDFGGFTLKSYVLTNINARIALGNQWSLVAQIDNVTDERYQLANGYNTAERGGSLAVRWNLR